MKWKKRCNVSALYGSYSECRTGIGMVATLSFLHASLHQTRQTWSLTAQTASEVASPSTQRAQTLQKQRNSPLEKKVATILTTPLTAL